MRNKEVPGWLPAAISLSSVIEQVEVLPQKRYVGIPFDSVKFGAR
jgi:hypothetical protein